MTACSLQDVQVYYDLDSSVASFLLSGTLKPGASLELERGVRESEGAGACMTFNPNINLSITQQRQRLPIFQVHQRASSRKSA